jgi:hypothetical protein
MKMRVEETLRFHFSVFNNNSFSLLSMPGCITCASLFPYLPINTTSCIKCIAIGDNADDEQQVADIRQWKQCSGCGFSSNGTINDLKRCMHCVVPEPTKNQTKNPAGSIVLMFSL